MCRQSRQSVAFYAGFSRVFHSRVFSRPASACATVQRHLSATRRCSTVIKWLNGSRLELIFRIETTFDLFYIWISSQIRVGLLPSRNLFETVKFAVFSSLFATKRRLSQVISRVVRPPYAKFITLNSRFCLPHVGLDAERCADICVS